jgi:hypothetical protein
MESHPLVTRRDVVKGGTAAITLAAASSPGPVFAAGDLSTVTGVVYEDLSGTGKRQPDDQTGTRKAFRLATPSGAGGRRAVATGSVAICAWRS